MEELTEWMKGLDAVLTNVDTPVYTPSDTATYYNLSGQPVVTPERGIYIKKGRKILVK